MQIFREAVDECGFIDLGFVGSQFTWQKHFADGHSIWERLDRALANNEWMLRFAESRVYHLSVTSSDHSPLWIRPKGLDLPRIAKPFRFEEMWLSDKGCTEVVEAVWSSQEGLDPNVRVVQKIEKCGKELTHWSKLHFGNVRSELNLKRRLLIKAEKEALQSGDNSLVRSLKADINDLLDKESRMWLQRSKVLWAKNGDQNSKYFHRRATQRYRKNSIVNIRNSEGHWCSDMEEVTATLVDYYRDLFTSSQPPQHNETLNSIQNIITEDMNSQLSAQFMAWEVKEAIKQMASLKVSGLDGMPPLFFSELLEPSWK